MKKLLMLGVSALMLAGAFSAAASPAPRGTQPTMQGDGGAPIPLCRTCTK